MTDVDAVAASSSFESDKITSSTDYYIFKGWLESYDVNHSSSKVSAYNGCWCRGQHGITTLQIKSIRSFSFQRQQRYSKMNASFAYLFGIDVQDKFHECTSGSEELQVFDSISMNPSCRISRTIPSGHVSVMRNEYFGIEAS